MNGNRGRSGAGLCVVALLGSTLIGASGISDNFDARVLTAQNVERTRLGLAPLRWNRQLAASAQGWADHLAATNRFEHAPMNPAFPLGENLWEGSRDYFGAESMVNAWVGEKKHFKPGVFPNNSVTGRVQDISHYTQVVWRNTSEVGCARASNASVDILVCRYAQAGNDIGEKPF